MSKRNGVKRLLCFIFAFIYLVYNFNLGLVFAAEASSHMSVSVTTDSQTVESGSYVKFKVDYNINNNGALKEGDYMEVRIPKGLENVQIGWEGNKHFKEIQKVSNSVYRLVFGPNVSIGYQGYFGLGAIARNNTNYDIDATVTVSQGNVESGSTITIRPERHGEVGTENRVLIKYAPTNPKNNYYTQVAAKRGEIKSGCKMVDFVIEVNTKNGYLDNVIVSDQLPYGMELVEGSLKIKRYYNGPYGMQIKDASAEGRYVSKSKDNFMVNFGNLNYSNLKTGYDTNMYRIEYTVKILDDTMELLNTAKIDYTENGVRSTGKEEFEVIPFDYSGSTIGYKKVDRNFIEHNDPNQIVTYTIVFENSNRFDKGGINIFDKLHGDVKYVSSEETDYFDVNYDEKTHIVNITNKKALEENVRQEIKIVTDFSNVKPGTTVSNTLYNQEGNRVSNIVKTEKEETPLVPVDPTKPEVPVDPTKPEVPVDPTKPEVPVDPTKPEVPVDPTKPEVPVDPTKPEVPVDPTKPEVPVDPTKPEVPVDPTKPEVPVDPTKPEVPVDPTKPEVPVDPTKPEVPVDPTKPEVPVDPTKPEVPVDPTKPEVPVDPTKPEVPVDPTKPEVPVDPTKPEVPVDPTKPEVPVDPTKPEVPVDPTKPEVPVDPMKPEVPVDPTKPEVPVDPTKPEVPEEPTKPEVPKESIKSGIENTTTTEDKSIPKTGYTQYYDVALLSMIASASIFFIIRKKEYK